jgi:chromate transporter
MSDILIDLAGIFGPLSLLAFGGFVSILPELQRQVVEVYGWMPAAEFTALYALAQAAPGPNMMIVSLVGWRMAGWTGVLVASAASFVPTSLLVLAALGLWERFKDRPWRACLQAGLTPVTIGLVAAGAWLMGRAVVNGALTGAILAAAALGSIYFVRLNPLWLLLGGALTGLAAGVFA